MHIPVAVILSIAVWILPAKTFGLCTTIQPQTVTGYVGERLSYTCEAFCGEKFWKLNDSYAQWETEYPYRAVIADGWRSTLSIEASAATNNSVVRCLLYNPPNNERSNATIIVQGTVAEPTNLRLTYDVENVYFSWNRPHTLPNTELIFAINVSIFNSSNFSFTTANTQLSFMYSSLNIDRCNSDHTVSLTVHGVNRAGEGEPSFVQVVIPRSQEENCSQAINRFGPPTDVFAAIEGESLTFSWQPPLLMLSPDNLCYKISVNVNESLDPQNILTQFVSNCTYNTIYALSLSSIGINRCNGDYLIEVSVAGMSSEQVEGDVARITTMIPSIKMCLPTESEEPSTVRFVPTTDVTSDSIVVLPDREIYIAAAVVGSSLLLGLLAASIVLLLLKKKHHRSKTRTIHHNVNAAYGINSMRPNEAYGCRSDKELHNYEEIKDIVYKSTSFKIHGSPNRLAPMEVKDYCSA